MWEQEFNLPTRRAVFAFVLAFAQEQQQALVPHLRRVLCG